MFFQCLMLSYVPVGVGASSRLEHIHEHAFSRTNLVEVWTPDSADSVKEHDRDGWIRSMWLPTTVNDKRY